MKKLKQQFAEMRKNTPKHIQWLLMAVAFVVVIILLILVLGNDDSEPQIVAKAPIEINIAPDMINWGDVVVGNSEKTTVKITASAPIKIVSVGTESDVNGFSVTDTCVGMGQINDELSCNVAMSFAPTAALGITQVPVNIQWHDADESDSMNKTSKIVVTLGATLPVVEKKPEPVVVPEPVKQPEPVAEPMVKSEPIKEPEIDEYEYEEPEPVKVSSTKQNIKRELESLAPSVKFQEEPVDNYVRPVETCSDFAFPAYGNSGKQIGWIKPSGGAYKYHPFSDTECNEPAGTYNPDNGIITDKSGKKIGTDAEHIGYSAISSGALPQLSNAPAVKTVNRAVQLDSPSASTGKMLRGMDAMAGGEDILKKRAEEDIDYTSSGTSVISSVQYDRQFVLRQFKPIPATIVSDVRADPEALKNNRLPVRATVDRNVYSDNGRNVIIPAGTLLMGYVDGTLPGPYTTIGRMDIKWYQFILPNGVEFNFDERSIPFSGDAQGRSGIPGYGSTDYLEQFFMPMLTAVVPAAVNLIAPISDAFVNQIDLDNNTVVQSGTMRSSEMAKNEIITTWNQIAQKLMVDMMDNTVPPFTIAAGTRITVYSPVDLIASCGGSDKKCSLGYGKNPRLDKWEHSTKIDETDGSWVGQVRSFNIGQYCIEKNGKRTADDACQDPRNCGGYDYRTVLMYCESTNYQSKTEIKQDAYHQSEVKKYQDTYGTEGDRTEEQQVAYDEMIGITYDDEGYVVNPFDTPVADEIAPAEEVLTCLDGSMPDANGCCAGEIFTDMGEMGFNCCPEGGGDCFPPIVVNAE